MKEELALKIKDMATPIVASLGYELVDVTFSKEYGKLNLNLFIYKKGGISLSDCEAVDSALNEPLEAIESDFETDYILNVSSLGLDRAIVTDDDYRRSQDTEIEVYLKDGVKGKNIVRGTLLAFDTDNITIVENNKGQIKKINILKQNIQKAQPWIKF